MSATIFDKQDHEAVVRTATGERRWEAIAGHHRPGKVMAVLGVPGNLVEGCGGRRQSSLYLFTRRE
ncbi:hypothetical protein CRG98_012603 [Punica granatum]|uniref:Uncharacterized protein n=1 Tax=Punica granatum TaxID=22663 RepID=A0A2I0KEY4_PUNGR|nr:hypothetical protein CRG98_012603 [Punica granatum]